MHQICTIIALNYIPQALTFLESFRKFDKVTPCTILVVDASSVDLRCDKNTKFISSESLPINPLALKSMYLYYDQVELATSFKPFLLRYLLDIGATTATYIDPDTQIFSSFDEIFCLTLEHDAVLTPHRITPLPNHAEKFYSERTFLKYGTYNLGFISVSRSGSSLLDWWSEKLVYNSTRFICDDVFTDQKWANQLPVYFDCLIYKGPEINIAPWNLDERKLSKVENRIYSQDIPVVMIHFSQMSSLLAKGLDSNLWESTFQDNSESRQSLEIITEITNDYREKLTSCASINYKFAPINFESNANLSVYYRKRIREKSMLGQEMNSAPFMALQKRIAKVRFFDQSQIFNAITIYLIPESKKFLSYLASRIFRRNT